jgi:hypothetical protein
MLMSVNQQKPGTMFFTLRMVYRNLTFERPTGVVALVLGFFSIWGIIVTVVCFNKVTEFYALYPEFFSTAYATTLASLAALFPILIIFVLLPILVFNQDMKSSKKRMERLRDTMCDEIDARNNA